MRIISGQTVEPRRVMIVGVEGVGKTSFAAGCPKTFFIDLEGGLNDVLCYARTEERIQTIAEFMNCLSWLATNQHDFEAIAIDTVDWLERLIFNDICVRKGNVSAIEEIPYGKGYSFAVPMWEEIIKALTYIQKVKRTKTILIGHCRIQKIKEPGMDTYDQYVPDLHPEAQTMLREWCDEVLFACFRTLTKTEDLGFNKVRNIALQTGDERFIRTRRSAHAVAKNRLRGIPEEIPVDWAAYAQYLPQASMTPPLPPAPAVAGPASADGNISGVVNDGSSKKEG